VADVTDVADKIERLEAATNAGGSGGSILKLRRPVAVAALPFIGGLALVAAGWQHAADTVKLSPALDGLALGAAGAGLVAVALVGLVAWLRSKLGGRLRLVLAGLSPASAAEADERVAEIDLSELWTAEGLRRYHRASCPALAHAGGARTPVTGGATDLEPCLICSARN
jgi:hypothetical protein